jgi:hypothetical protein
MPGHARFQLRWIRAVIFSVQKSHLFPKCPLAIEHNYFRRFICESLGKFFRNEGRDHSFLARLLIATAEFDFDLGP